jgi:hypothetical protein
MIKTDIYKVLLLMLGGVGVVMRRLCYFVVDGAPGRAGASASLAVWRWHVDLSALDRGRSLLGPPRKKDASKIKNEARK